MEFLKLQLGDLSFRFYFTLLSVSLGTAWLSLLSGGGALSIVVAIFGIIYAFFAGQKKVICFFAGIIYSSLYAYIAYNNRLYGDMMLNIFFLPINIWGIFLWSAHQNQEKTKIYTRSLSKKQMFYYGALVGVGSLVYGMYLQTLQASYAYLNAFSVIAQIVAFYLQVKRYHQNYLLVTLANFISIVIWGLIWDTSREQVAQLLNMVIFFVIGIYYYIEWSKEGK